MKYLVVLLLITTPAAARMGGGQSYRGSSSSHRRSYSAPVVRSPNFGRSRATSNAPIVRSYSGTTRSYPVYTSPTVVVHDSGPSLLTQMMFWHMWTQPQQPQVVVVGANGQQQVQGQVQPEVIVQQQPQQSHWFLWLLFFVIVGALVWWIIKAMEDA